MKISSILDISGCRSKLSASTKEEALRIMSDLLSKNKASGTETVDSLLKGMMDREELGSTGMGDGIAIPHCRLAGMKSFALTLTVCDKGIAWDSIDGRSVHIICAIAGPVDGTDEHLRLLAGAARVLSNSKARYELINSKTDFAMRETFLYHLSPVTSSHSRESRKKLLLMVLQEEKAYNDVMELFLEMGVEGAVTVNSDMMGPMLSNVPIFAGFMDVLGRSRPEPRLLLTLIPEEEVGNTVAAVEAITGDLDNHRGACIIVLDTVSIRGSLETL
ncbi:MAG: PTS sugar transporter subunit IIA [Candidatus Sabulitectum sp.]|nr:PTS sugar transporter subunit IIA [Candidatus Sabulitectum sp.]